MEILWEHYAGLHSTAHGNYYIRNSCFADADLYIQPNLMAHRATSTFHVREHGLSKGKQMICHGGRLSRGSNL